MIRELDTKQAAGALTQARGTSKSNAVLSSGLFPYVCEYVVPRALARWVLQDEKKQLRSLKRVEARRRGEAIEAKAARDIELLKAAEDESDRNKEGEEWI